MFKKNIVFSYFITIFIFSLVFLNKNAQAASSFYVSQEIGQNSSANRTATDLLDDDWINQLNSLGMCSTGCLSTSSLPNTGTHIDGSAILTSSWGAQVLVSTWGNVDTSQNSLTGNSIGNGAYASAGGNGMQDDSPRPASLVSSSNGFFTQNSSGGSSRNGILFEFTEPVQAFGAWFGDLETRNDGYGTPAIVRLYDASGNLISSSDVQSSTANQGDCSWGAGAPTGEVPNSNDFNGCGNDTTRWIGFINTNKDRVSKMLVIVGDDDRNSGSGNDSNGFSERISFIGPKVAYLPQLSSTKKLISNINNGDGTYSVSYDITATNITLESAMSDFQIFDNLASTFTNINGALTPTDSSSTIQVPPANPLSAISINPSYGNGGDWNLLAPGGKLEANDSITIRVSTKVRPIDNLGVFNNSAEVSGSVGGTQYSDGTNDGDNSDLNNNEIYNESSDNIPTPISFEESPSIGLAKNLSSVTEISTNNYDVSFEFNVVNLGNIVLNDLSLKDDLESVFSGLNVDYYIKNISSSDFTINNGYNGKDDIELLASGNTLQKESIGTIYITINVNNITSNISVFNSAVVMAKSPALVDVEDISQNGKDVDPDQNKNANDNSDPTPVNLEFKSLPSIDTDTETETLASTGNDNNALIILSFSVLALNLIVIIFLYNSKIVKRRYSLNV